VIYVVRVDTGLDTLANYGVGLDGDLYCTYSANFLN